MLALRSGREAGEGIECAFAFNAGRHATASPTLATSSRPRQLLALPSSPTTLSGRGPSARKRSRRLGVFGVFDGHFLKHGALGTAWVSPPPVTRMGVGPWGVGPEQCEVLRNGRPEFRSQMCARRSDLDGYE